MKRYVLAAVIFVSLLLLSPPASARRLRAFRANVISPRATYRNGFYRNPRLRYRPYATYYSYPRGAAWSYPRFYRRNFAPKYYYTW